MDVKFSLSEKCLQRVTKLIKELPFYPFQIQNEITYVSEKSECGGGREGKGEEEGGREGKRDREIEKE
jgi:hypothetical protein